MKQRMEVVKKDGCCKKKEAMKGICSMANENSTCGKPVHEENMPAGKKCGMQTEQACVCICVFQFAAPDQLGAKFLFGTSIVQQSLAGYLQRRWKDPMLALPWQPPDYKLIS